MPEKSPVAATDKELGSLSCRDRDLEVRCRTLIIPDISFFCFPL